MKARVKKNNSYGWQPEGTIVEVEPEELARVPWCLEAVEEDVPLPPSPQPPPPAMEPIKHAAAADHEPASQEEAPMFEENSWTPATPAPKKGKK